MGRRHRHRDRVVGCAERLASRCGGFGAGRRRRDPRRDRRHSDCATCAFPHRRSRDAAGRRSRTARGAGHRRRDVGNGARTSSARRHQVDGTATRRQRDRADAAGDRGVGRGVAAGDPAGSVVVTRDRQCRAWIHHPGRRRLDCTDVAARLPDARTRPDARRLGASRGDRSVRANPGRQRRSSRCDAREFARGVAGAAECREDRGCRPELSAGVGGQRFRRLARTGDDQCPRGRRYASTEGRDPGGRLAHRQSGPVRQPQRHRGTRRPRTSRECPAVRRFVSETGHGRHRARLSRSRAVQRHRGARARNHQPLGTRHLPDKPGAA